MSIRQEPSEDAEQAREQVQSLRHRALVLITIGTATYLLAMASLATFRLSGDSGAGSNPLSIVLSMDFADAAAILGVLSGVIIAINVIVWQSIRGSVDPRAYAYAQFMSIPAYFVGQAAIVVAISSLIRYAPNEIDLPRMVTILIACSAVVVIAIHTSDGLDSGASLARDVRVIVVSNEVRQLENVLRRWPHSVRAGVTLPLALARDLGVCAAIAAAPLVAVVVGQAIVDGDVAKALAQVPVAIGIAVLVSLIFGALTTMAVRYFVIRSFGGVLSCAVFLLLFASTVFAGVVVAVMDSGLASVSQVAATIGMLALLLTAFVLPVAGLARTTSGLLPGAGMRWVVRRGIEGELSSRSRFLGITPDSQPDPRAGRVGVAMRRVVKWYREATGVIVPEQ